VTRGILAVTLALTALSVLALPSLAGDSVCVVGHGGSADAHGDGSGRQIAQLSPIVQASPHSVHTTWRASTTTIGWKKVSFSVPTNVDEAADYCVVTASRLGKAAGEKAVAIGAWLSALSKQLGSPGTITPGGPTYQQTPLAKPQTQALNYQNRLWYMPDGRLKTLTQR
jgi:hypothetical protein